MKIVFCLPGTAHAPTGGTKVVCEYANHLVGLGHEVTLVLPAINLVGDTWPHRLYRYGLFAVGLAGGGPERWFPLRPEVARRFVADLSPGNVPDADVVVATFWKTAEWVAAYPAAKGRKHYLIQHHEVWAGPPARVGATWRAPMTRVVPARWLADVARGYGVEAAHVPNGLDMAEFGIDAAPGQRAGSRIMTLFNPLRFKASGDAIAGLAALRRTVPQVEVTVFGAGRRPALPDGFSYVRRPTRVELRALYNRSAVYVAPSHSEGWDLPATEAMLCGCALVASDVDGHWEYAVHERNALLFPAGDLAALGAAVGRLIQDAPLRLKLALAGAETARGFTWGLATQRLAAIFAASAPVGPLSS